MTTPAPKRGPPRKSVTHAPPPEELEITPAGNTRSHDPNMSSPEYRVLSPRRRPPTPHPKAASGRSSAAGVSARARALQASARLLVTAARTRAADFAVGMATIAKLLAADAAAGMAWARNAAVAAATRRVAPVHRGGASRRPDGSKVVAAAALCGALILAAVLGAIAARRLPGFLAGIITDSSPGGALGARLARAESQLATLAAQLSVQVAEQHTGASQPLRLEIAELRKRIAESAAAVNPSTTPAPARRPALVSREDVVAIVEAELDTYAADKTGQPDYALATADGFGGGRVISHSALSSRVVGGSGLERLLSAVAGAILGGGGAHPAATGLLLRPGPEVPGDCLGLAGSTGHVTIALREPVLLSAVTVEHIAAAAAFDIRSAPGRFRLSGGQMRGGSAAAAAAATTGEALERGAAPAATGGPLGTFKYDALGGRPVQTFAVAVCAGERPPAGCFADTVRLDLESNHGHPEWTCLYRVRVHGRPLETSTT